MRRTSRRRARVGQQSENTRAGAGVAIGFRRSTRGPAEFATAEEVQMQVRDGLARSLLAVKDEAVAVLEPELLGEAGGDEVEVPHNGRVLVGQVGVGADHFSRY